MTTRTKKLDDRAHAWELAKQMARQKGGFTSFDLCALMRRSPEWARQAIRDWLRWGYVKQDGMRGRRNVYVILPKDGTPPAADAFSRVIRETSAEQNMWRAMRTLRVFSHLDVAMHARTATTMVSDDRAREYCRALANAGYFKVLQTANTRGRVARYKLLHDTGPVAPRERRVRGIWDDNIERFMHVAGGLIVDS